MRIKHEKLNEAFNGFAVPRIVPNPELARDFLLKNICQEKLKYEMAVANNFNFDVLGIMNNVMKIQIQIFDKIRDLGDSHLRFSFYVCSLNSSNGQNVIKDPPLCFEFREQFYEIFAARIIEMSKILIATQFFSD